MVPGEKSKSHEVKQKIEEQMLKNHFDRNTKILAVGGGVVGDLAGFVAATYMRGIPYVQIPTTFLAMVDSSIGGKTAINTRYGKNSIGAFWPPKAVLLNMACLQTLSKKHLRNGLIEALKMFLIADKKSFIYAEKNLCAILKGDDAPLKKIICAAIKIKSHIVNQDARDQNIRMSLNFGHTIGHALEFVLEYKILHGIAVAYGILVEAKISVLLDILDAKTYQKIYDVFRQLGITTNFLQKINCNKIIAATKKDKKNSENKVRYILLKTMGDIYKKNGVVAHEVSDRIVKKAFLALSEE
jgi:3-dehydroquinate synthase